MMPVLAAEQLPLWTSLLLQGMFLIVSAGFAIAAWGYKREIQKRDQNQKDIQENLKHLLRLIPVSEALKENIDAEEEERKYADEQLLGRVNKALMSISALGTTVSATQAKCRDTFITQQEWSRMERLRERQDEMLTQQIMRLESSVERVIMGLQNYKRRGT
jgi:hypothetical protein